MRESRESAVEMHTAKSKDLHKDLLRLHKAFRAQDLGLTLVTIPFTDIVIVHECRPGTPAHAASIQPGNRSPYSLAVCVALTHLRLVWRRGHDP